MDFIEKKDIPYSRCVTGSLAATGGHRHGGARKCLRQNKPLVIFLQVHNPELRADRELVHELRVKLQVLVERNIVLMEGADGAKRMPIHGQREPAMESKKMRPVYQEYDKADRLDLGPLAGIRAHLTSSSG